MQSLAVPIATRDPLPNVQFEMHNINEPVRWADDTMDFVHARANDMAVRVLAVYSLLKIIDLKVAGLQLSRYGARSSSCAAPRGTLLIGRMGAGSYVR